MPGSFCFLPKEVSLLHLFFYICKFFHMDTNTNLDVEEVIADVSDDTTTDQPEKEPEEAKNTEDKYKDALRGLSEKGSIISKYEEEMVDLVRDTPEKLHDIKNSRLKNKIARKLYGVSYEQAVELGKVDEVEIDDSHRDVLEIKHKLAKQEERERENTERKFFKDKGILISEFDDNYSKVMEQLEAFTPSVLERDYEGALGKAYMLAFPSQVGQKQRDAADISAELATPASSGGTRKASDTPPKVTHKDLAMLRGLGATKTLTKLGIK